MSELKYVPAGAFMLCNKCIAPVPIPLLVTSQASVALPGGTLATTFDELPLHNVPPFGVCGITHGPCTYCPQPPGWQPVQELVQAGPLGGHPLLENSKMRCMVGGEISLYLTRQAAMDTLPDIVSRGLASLYASMEGIPLLSGLQTDVALVRGAWQGLYAMGEGLVALAKLDLKLKMAVGKAVVFAVQHPIQAGQAVAEGTQKAATAGWQAVTNKDNWATAGEVAVDAVPGVLFVKGGIWLSDADNRAKLGKAYDVAAAYGKQLTPFERENLAGRAVFEVVALLGAPETKVAEAGKAAELLKGGEALAKVADISGHGGEAANGVRLAGEVTTGAKGLAEAGVLEKAPSTFEEVVAGVEECLSAGHPVDVANGRLFTQATDFTLPGPLPLVWERTWFSTSSHQGVLGHGWHHAYDLGFTLTADGGGTLRLADGRQVSFALPAPGQRTFSRRHKLELAHDAAGFRVWNLRQRVWYVFDAIPLAGTTERLLQAVEDANGLRIQFAYSPAAHLAAITDSAGRHLRCDTDATGRLLALHAPDPDQPGATFPLVRYAYDEAGDLVSATDALGHAAYFVYEGHLLTRETFRSGLNFYFKYDGAGLTARCVHTWGDGGIFDTRLRYNSPGHTTVWDSYGHQKEYHHQRGLVSHFQNALGAVQQWRYNQYAELEHTIDPLGQLTRYDYDARGQQTRVVYPDGAQVSTQFNELGCPEAGTDANGETWERHYDAQGRLTSIVNALGAIVRYAYDEQGRLHEVTNALGQLTRLRYDAYGNPAHTVGPDGSIQSSTYDALGRLVKLIDATGHVQHRRYNRGGQLTEMQLPEGLVQRLTYDAEGNVVRLDDGNQVIEFTYTAMGQVTHRRQGGQQVQFTYDREGNLTSLLNEQNDLYRFVLDATGKVEEEVGFDGLTRQYTRDAAGRVTHVARPAGRSTAYSYDAAGRVTEVMHNDTERISYRYRADGALLEATNQVATVGVERDALGRVLRETLAGHTVSSTYDARGQRLSLNSSLGASVAFERDSLGQVRHTQAGGWQSVVERDAEGLEVYRQLSGGVASGWQRDTQGRPVRQRITAGNSSSWQRRHQWQANDQLTEIDDSRQGVTQFAYDEWDNLAATTHPDGTQELRQPDAVGNLFRTAPRTDRRYGKSGQLQQAGARATTTTKRATYSAKRCPMARLGTTPGMELASSAASLVPMATPLPFTMMR